MFKKLFLFLILGFSSTIFANDAFLHKAVEKGSYDDVEDFLNQGIDVNLANQSGTTALHWASLHGHDQIAELLLARGANVDVPLHTAAQHGYAHLVRLFLARGANAHAANLSGNTPLHVAMMNEHELVVAELFRSTNLNTRNMLLHILSFFNILQQEFSH